MVKMLRVDDDVHEIITKLAKADDRGVTAFVNRTFREMDNGVSEVDEVISDSQLELEGGLENPSSSQPEQTSSKLPRDKELIKQINEISDIIEQADETNQDPDYWAYMNELREEVKGLWKEWHDVTGR